MQRSLAMLALAAAALTLAACATPSTDASATLRVRAVRYGWAESEEVAACFAIAGAPCP